MTGLAQSAERLTAEREVAGSIPGTGPILRVLKKTENWRYCLNGWTFARLGWPRKMAVRPVTGRRRKNSVPNQCVRAKYIDTQIKCFFSFFFWLCPRLVVNHVLNSVLKLWLVKPPSWIGVSFFFSTLLYLYKDATCSTCYKKNWQPLQSVTTSNKILRKNRLDGLFTTILLSCSSLQNLLQWLGCLIKTKTEDQRSMTKVPLKAKTYRQSDERQHVDED